MVIQQTLHGYAEGHRLLEGSIKFNDEIARLILRMSDLSGNSVVSGFEEYLTGYPLEALNMYALAKTWSATELPRPGCVWTHTLFISDSCMAEISDLHQLIRLFVRPSASTAKGYSKPIEFEVSEIRFQSSSESGNSETQIADLVDALYVRGKEKVLIATQTSRVYEAALLRVWSQQWPVLRRRFSFCTGALSARGFAGKPFDVQCTPPSLVREITSTSVTRYSQEVSLLAKNDDQRPPWFNLAVADANNPRGGTFRRLLWGFADDADLRSYGHFARLIERLLQSSTPNAASEFIAVVADLFPNPAEASSLKVALFGKKQEIKRFDEFEVLSSLASTTHFQAYNAEALQLRSRGNDLCRLDPRFAKQIIFNLFRSPINPLGEQILTGVMEGMNPSIAREIGREQPQYLPTLFRAKPELGVSPDLWRMAGDHRREVLACLIAHPNLGSPLVGEIVEAMLDSDSDFLLRSALEEWGDSAVAGVFGWLCNGKGRLSEQSRTALTFHVKGVVGWLAAASNPPELVVIEAAHIVAPYHRQFRDNDSSMWLHTFRSLMNRGAQKEANYFAALLLALGLQNAPTEPLALIDESFARVHQLAADDKMPHDTWVILDPVVPHLWLHDWDKCERLRRGLLEAFVKYRWPVAKLSQYVRNFPRLIESAKKVDGGKELLSRIF